MPPSVHPPSLPRVKKSFTNRLDATILLHTFLSRFQKKCACLLDFVCSSPTNAIKRAGGVFPSTTFEEHSDVQSKRPARCPSVGTGGERRAFRRRSEEGPARQGPRHAAAQLEQAGLDRRTEAEDLHGARGLPH